MERVEPARIAPVVLGDPADDHVLACAVGGRAHCIVSGDGHLLALRVYADIPIWGVQQFLHAILTRQP